MRTATILILVLASFCLLAVPAGATTYARTGFHMDWWHTETGTDGFQYHVPVEVGGSIQNFSFKLLSAYVHNEIDPDAGDSYSFDGVVDTKLNLAYESIGKLPVDILFAVDFNLPTGQTGLAAQEVVSILDPDKVTITRMGEGFNVNPNISLLKQWDSLLTAIGVGYIWRGSFDAADTLQDYDPGDALNVTADVAYLFNPNWTGNLFGSYTQFGKDQLADVDYYQPGDVTIIGASLTYGRAKWEVTGKIKAILRDKESRQNDVGVLLPEAEDYFGDEYVGELKGRVQLSDIFALTAWVQYLTIGENEYPVTSVYYLGQRQKTLVGCELAGRFTERWEAALGVQGYQTRLDDTPANPAAGTDFDGGSVTLKVIARF